MVGTISTTETVDGILPLSFLQSTCLYEHVKCLWDGNTCCDCAFQLFVVASSLILLRAVSFPWRQLEYLHRRNEHADAAVVIKNLDLVWYMQHQVTSRVPHPMKTKMMTGLIM